MIRLLLTSGRGPAECRLALARAIDQMQKEAARCSLTLDIALGEAPDAHGAGSAVALVQGEGAEAFAQGWTGTVQWIARSPLRPNHRRKNWFIGVFRLDPLQAVPRLDERDIRFETTRAGGPGGQHQNTTDSAVRAIHLPTGIAVLSRAERSQHRNKAEAVRRLEAMLAEKGELARMQADKDAWAAHEKLERGAAVRRL